MALTAAGTVEVENGGSDTNNSGGFTTGSSGTDASKSTSNTVNATDGSGVAANTLASISHSFVAGDVGNFVYYSGVASGGTATLGYYNINSVLTGTATLDRNASSVGATGIVYAVGGCYATPGQIGFMFANGGVGGMTAWIKYNATAFTNASATANIGNGCLSPTAGTSTATTRIIGYNTTRGDGGAPPTFKAGAAGCTLITAAGNTHIENLILDGGSQTTSKAFVGVASSRAYRITGQNCTGLCFSGGGIAELCYTTTNSGISFSGMTECECCTAVANTASGFSGGNVSDSVAANNSGATTDGFTTAGNNETITNCTSYNNGRHGFNFASGTAVQGTGRNLIATQNGQTGGAGFNFTASGSGDNCFLYYCFEYNGKSAVVNGIASGLIPAANQFGCQTLTGDPFVAAGSLNFALNSTSGAGAVCRNAGTPGNAGAQTLLGLSSSGYVSAGALEAQPAAATSALNRGILTGGRM